MILSQQQGTDTVGWKRNVRTASIRWQLKRAEHVWKHMKLLMGTEKFTTLVRKMLIKMI